MKRTHRCPKCAHNRILYIAQVADLDDRKSSSHASPMKLARIEKELGSVFGGQTSSIDVAGEIEAGMCRSCGYVELYVKDPASIPVDGRLVRELVGPE